jgi:predicted metal-dependent phosphoesterase TrpH
VKAKIDLHVHTSASDGKHSPEAIVELAARRGVGVLAIADHDTVNGLAPARQAARNYPGLQLIPAIELSSHCPGSEVHILGYFVRCDTPEIIRELDTLRDSREERVKAMVEKLRGLGLDIQLQRVQEIAGTGSIGRPHIALALLEKGYVSDFQEVFTRYIGQGGPAYVERHKLSPAEAIKFVLRCGGLPVLAHPTTVDNLLALLPELKAAGLAGLEVYYKDYPTEKRQELAQLAGQNSLIATGGSDYHGLDEAAEIMLGEAGVPRQAAEALFALAQKKGIKTDV